jgi:hypothetical protein
VLESFGWEKPDGRKPKGIHIVDGRIILKCIFEKWNGGTDWIDVSQDRDRWRALGNSVIKIGFYKMLGTFWLAEKLLASQEELCPMELVS